MRAFSSLTSAISGLFHLTPETVSPALTFSHHHDHTSLSSVSSRQALDNVSIDIYSLGLALLSVLAILLLIPPFFAFISELIRRLSSSRGPYDRVDSSEYDYYYDYESGSSSSR